MLTILCLLLSVARLGLVAAIVVSWFPSAPGTLLGSLRSLLDAIFGPVLGPLRRVLPTVPVGRASLDLSPVVALVVVTLVQVVIGC